MLLLDNIQIYNCDYSSACEWMYKYVRVGALDTALHTTPCQKIGDSYSVKSMLWVSLLLPTHLQCSDVCDHLSL